MIDIQFIRENTELVKKSAEAKNIKIDIDELLNLDEQRRKAQLEIEKLREDRNKLADLTKQAGGKPSEEILEKGKSFKEQLAELESKQAEFMEKYDDLILRVPNIIPDDTPEGGEENNRAEKHWGDANKNPEAKDHLAWGEANGTIDFERGTKIAGNKFYFLKGALVELELAVFQLGLSLATKYGFTPITVPHMVNTRTMSGAGYMPRGEERQVYKIEGEDLNLIATAEIPITGYHADEVIDEKNLPLLYVGLSPAYRMEAGAYGKHSKGLYRVHQFNKLELYVFCKPEDDEKWLQKIVELEEELIQALEIPYQLVRIAAGDLGGPAYKKFDIEYWSPVEGEYRELTSCSNVTDYQARRLNIRYRSADGTVKYVHTLNGTAMAFSRVCIALIENHQQGDKLKVPKALQPFLSNKEII